MADYVPAIGAMVITNPWIGVLMVIAGTGWFTVNAWYLTRKKEK